VATEVAGTTITLVAIGAALGVLVARGGLRAAGGGAGDRALRAVGGGGRLALAPAAAGAPSAALIAAAAGLPLAAGSLGARATDALLVPIRRRSRRSRSARGAHGTSPRSGGERRTAPGGLRG
jgi:hypothetical protein